MNRRRILFWLSLPLLCLALLVLVVALVEAVVRLEPVTPSALPSAPVTIVADERIFTLMAALNASGYDDENNEQGMHPVRQAVRAALAAKPLSTRLWLHTQLCRRLHESKCIEWILQRGAPPTFARAVDGWWVDVPAFLFAGFATALQDFYGEADIATLWREYKPAYEAEAARYQEHLDPALQTVYRYLGVAPAADAYVVMAPDLLNAYWRGYGPQIGPISYIISGPALDPNVGLLQHEVMHPIMNPLVDANLGVIEPAQTERLWAALQPHMPSSYSTWQSAMYESTIRAIEVRLLPPEDREYAMQREEAAGFLLIRPLADQLADYEASGVDIRTYMPTWFAALNAVTLP